MPLIRIGLIVGLLVTVVDGARSADFQVFPPTVQLDGSFERAQLLVMEGLAAPSERTNDLTHQAAYQSSNPQVVTVSRTGQLLAGSNGDATVTVTVAGIAKVVPVKVSGVTAEPKVGFLE